MTNKTLEQTIGEFFKERREKKEKDKFIYEILRENGYKDSVTEGLFDNEIDFLGRPKKYKKTYKFGKPFNQGFGEYSLIPVSYHNEYCGCETEFLTLVNRRTRKVTIVADAGDRGIRYIGKCKLKPLAFVITDKGKAIVSYKYTLHADWNNLKVGEDIWGGYLFRHSEYRIAHLDLREDN